jgi:hypothetical protein
MKKIEIWNNKTWKINMIKHLAVSSTAIFVLVVIGMMLTASLVIFWRWMDLQGQEANEFYCKIKQKNYCAALLQGENPNWDEINPKTGCEKFGIAKPTLEECKKAI